MRAPEPTIESQQKTAQIGRMLLTASAPQTQRMV
jgi:hypothetical protein